MNFGLSIAVNQLRSAQTMERTRMKHERQIGLLLMLVGTAIYVFFGIALERRSPGGMAEFKALYYGSRCLDSSTSIHIKKVNFFGSITQKEAFF